MTILDRTMDAVILDVEALADVDTSALRRRFERLLTAGVDIYLVTRKPLTDLDGLAEAWPAGPGRVRALQDTGDGDGFRAALADLAARGVRPDGVVLMVDDVAVVPGGLVLDAAEHDVLGLLDDQLWRRAGLHVPAVADVPGWSVVEPVPPGAGLQPRDVLFVIGDGAFATRGGLEEVPGAATVLASGVWAGLGPSQHLLPGPQWTGLDLTGPSRGGRRMLDLRSGALLREDGEGPGTLRTLRFASAARPGLHVLRAEGPVERFSAGRALFNPHPGDGESGTDGDVEWSRSAGADGWIVAAAVQTQVDHVGRRTVMRLAVHRSGPNAEALLKDAVATVHAAQVAGFERLLAEHRHVWSKRWAGADVEVPADPSAQLALRFALFQLWVNAGLTDGALADEQAVGAKGLSGPGYDGHVFWDADVFVLPAVASFCPAAARAMLEYRLRRLPAAARRAKESGREGVRFPWESARDGTEITPSSITVSGQLIAVRTGEHEEHITADVAWAADRYAQWTGDTGLLEGPGRPLIVETARYWASRVRRDPDGTGHIEGVIGPDEYHEDVDDNVYTNVMAAWNLRRGADLLTAGAPGAPPDPGTADRWRAIADSLVTGFDPATGLHEQFTGFLALEPLVAAEMAPLPFPADLVLGQHRVQRSQLIKQPDVLMAHYLLPGVLPPESLDPDLDLYVPRTSHGSSLSPAITAGLLALAGRPDEALTMYGMALRLDLDDLTGSGASGLHIATLGGVWQALITGFLGISVVDGVLAVDPHLPQAWPLLRVRLHVLGALVTVTAEPGRVRVGTDRAVRVRAHGYPALEVRGEVTFDGPS